MVHSWNIFGILLRSAAIGADSRVCRSVLGDRTTTRAGLSDRCRSRRRKKRLEDGARGGVP